MDYCKWNDLTTDSAPTDNAHYKYASQSIEIPYDYVDTASDALQINYVEIVDTGYVAVP